MDPINWFLTTFTSWSLLETYPDTKIKVFISPSNFINLAKSNGLSQKKIKHTLEEWLMIIVH